MTKRLTLVGFAAVAVLWGPYVYAELVRRPLEKPPEELVEDPVRPSIPAMPVAYAPAPNPAVDDSESSLAAAIDPGVIAQEPAELEGSEPEPLIEAHEAPPPVDATDPPPPPAESTDPPPPPAAEAAEEPAAQEPAAAAHTAVESEDPGEAEPAEPEPAATVEPEPAPAEPEPEADGTAVALRTAFDGEIRDGEWAESEESRIGQLLTVVGVPEGAVRDVRCQRTICRIAVDAGELEAADPQLLERAQRQLGRGFGVDRAGGSPALYIVRRAL